MVKNLNFSFEPDSNQRPKDYNDVSLQSSALPTPRYRRDEMNWNQLSHLFRSI